MSVNPSLGGGARKRGGAYQPPRLTPDEFQRISEIFRSWVDSSNLKWWIIAAGVGAILDALHTVWLAVRYLKGF